jgi:hypothetical protein
MAIDTFVIGNDGNVTMPSSGSVMRVRSFAANLSRVESEQTGFLDTGRRKRLGMLDLTGSLSGVPAVDSTASTTTAATSLIWMNTATQALTLTIFDGATTADARIAANCIFNGFAFNVDKTADSTVTCNFANADGAAPVVTWLV